MLVLTRYETELSMHRIRFGHAVAVLNGRIIASAIDGTNSDGVVSGIVFVFERTQPGQLFSPFKLQQVLSPASPLVGALFGYSIALRQDSVIIGSPGSSDSSGHV